jgi:peptide/nickel transport system ATP-binding protein
MTETALYAGPLSSAEHSTYMAENEPVLTAHDISITYEVNPPVHAVKNVSLTLNRGEILGLAGESGCGKTTLAYGINQLLKPPALRTGGEITFHDKDGTDINVASLSGDSLRAFRWDKISMVFQGAMNSLNPVISIKAPSGDVQAGEARTFGGTPEARRCGPTSSRLVRTRTVGRYASARHDRHGPCP